MAAHHGERFWHFGRVGARRNSPAHTDQRPVWIPPRRVADIEQRTPPGMGLRGVPSDDAVPWPRGIGTIWHFASRFPVFRCAVARTRAAPHGSRRPRTRRQAQGATPGCFGGSHRRPLAGCWVVLGLHIVRLSVVGVLAYFVIRLLRSDDPRWWVAVGAAIGLGMMTKYAMAFLLAGVVGGVLLTPARRYLKSPWLWCGAAVALLIMLPNIVWQIHHHLISLEWLKSVHARDIGWGWTDYFLPNQLWKCANPVTVPLWCAGLWYLFAVPDGKRYRMLGWMYVIPLLALFIARGRDYYLAPAYPMLLAAGAVWGEQWLSSLSARSALIVRRITWRTLAVAGLTTAAVTLPIAPLNSAWWRVADNMNGGNFNMQIGWPELVETVAKIRDSLPAQDRARLGVLAGDEGETGAVNLYGPAYGLPSAISGMNSNWLRGYGDPPPQTLILVGLRRDFAEQNFESCELVGRVTNRYGIENDTITGYADVFVCRNLRQPWPVFWQHFRYYG